MLNPLNIISKFFKSSNQKELDKLVKFIDKINQLEDEISKLKDNEFIDKTEGLKRALRDGKKINDLLPEAFALVREASKRIYQERHFDVQLIGGLVLNQNKIAEMKTGEGKTLTIALAVFKLT